MSAPSNAFLAAVSYDPDTGIFTRLSSRSKRHLGPVTRTSGASGYIRVTVNGEWYYGHRLAWFMVHGAWPPHTIDHRNGNRSDNRIENLREATLSENGANRPRNSARLPRGVTKTPRQARPYRAQIKSNNRRFYLGNFATPEEAHVAFCAAAKRLHGEFARYD